MVYADNGLEFNKPCFYQLFREHAVKLYDTKQSAMVNERFKRTLKSMIWKRFNASKEKNKKWQDFIDDVLNVYSNEMVSSVTGMTPADARKTENTLQVKINWETRRHNAWSYANIEVGDNVGTFYKKQKQAKKENLPIWSIGKV